MVDVYGVNCMLWKPMAPLSPGMTGSQELSLKEKYDGD